MKRALPLALILSGLIGCSSSPYMHEWVNTESKALNIARSAGINGMKDTELPADITESEAFKIPLAAISAMSGYTYPVAELSSWSSAGIGVANLLFSPTPRSKRNSFFFWDEQAQTKEELYANFITAFESAKKQFNTENSTYKIRSGYRDKERSVAFVTLKPSWYMDISGKGCTTTEVEYGCAASFNLEDVLDDYNPTTGRLDKHTDITDGHSYTNYKVCLRNSTEDKLECLPRSRNKVNNGFNEVDFLLQFTQYLPQDYYLYAAPKQLYLGKDKPIKVPFIINKGRPLYFIKPQVELSSI